MIQRGLAFLREARNAPVHPATAILGAACVILGAGVVQRFLAQQQAALAAGWREFQIMQAQGAELLRQMDEAAKPYPAPEDLDPVGRGAHLPPYRIDLTDEEQALAAVGTTEGADR